MSDVAGYSPKPLLTKLGLQPQHQVCLLGDVPQTFEHLIVETYPELRFQRRLDSQFEYLHFFTTDQTELAMIFPKLINHLAPHGMIWISWPKKTARVFTNLDENQVREIGLQHGVVDVKVCAIDHIWSGLKFYRRIAR